MKRGGQPQVEFIRWRFYLANFFILFLILLLIARMADLTLWRQHFLAHQGDVRSLRTVKIPAFRGLITDRDGYPLAISAPVASVWIDPVAFQPTTTQWRDLIKLLPGIKQPKMHAVHHFAWLKRSLAPDLGERVRQLHIAGLWIRQEYRRFYPDGEITAHVIGFANVDNHGEEGLELAYDDWLAGVAGSKQVIQNRYGQAVTDVQVFHKQHPGHDLTLSLNRRIQYLAYQELKAGVENNLAASASVIVMDSRTGEVLAMASQPAYNPNHILPNEKDHFRNRAITDSFEPGSTIKTFSVVSALESGQYQPDSLINTAPGWLRVGHHVIRDEHNNKLISLTQILELSSDVGITKVTLSLPHDRLPNFLHRIGFGQLTGIHFPGEQSGRLPVHANWKPSPLAHLSFGYGISVTALQLVQAYQILANGGIKVPATLLRVDQPPVGTRVLSADVAKKMLVMLQAVVDQKGATGRAARIPGYSVAGKTGTAWIAGAHGYGRNHHQRHYTSTFIGVAPASHPRLIVAVIIRDPMGKHYYASDVSAPVFAKIMAGALRILDIPPDEVSAVS